MFVDISLVNVSFEKQVWHLSIASAALCPIALRSAMQAMQMSVP